MAIALLPIFILSLLQAQSDFRRQTEEQRTALQLAVKRSTASARAQVDGTKVLLLALSPDSASSECRTRLNKLVTDLDAYETLARLSPTGQITCISDDASTLPSPSIHRAASSEWFSRLRDGSDMVVSRAPGRSPLEPSLIVAVRIVNENDQFEGAMVAIQPLSSLQPDVNDPALPIDTEAALTDASGQILATTSVTAFNITPGKRTTDWGGRLLDKAASIFEARTESGELRVYATSALANGALYALLSAPAPGMLSWARLNPIGTLLLPLTAWLTAFAAVMLLSERVVIRWLDYLERVAAIYAKGRFSVRPLQAKNAPLEIRVLGQTLDEMAAAITVRDSELKASLAEKDALMREIHHRVKNNLQIISSLLSMQQRTVTDPAAKQALGDTRQRISALALIYRTLYQSEDIRQANSQAFLSELVAQLVNTEAFRGSVVNSLVEADSLAIDPDKLPPLALWLVEAITNAQKHAFAKGGSNLQVRFKVEGPISILEVIDDGPGPGNDDSTGVGLTLMYAFAKQLRGECDLIPGPNGGAIARLEFSTPGLAPIDRAEPRV